MAEGQQLPPLSPVQADQLDRVRQFLGAGQLPAPTADFADTGQGRVQAHAYDMGNGTRVLSFNIPPERGQPDTASTTTMVIYSDGNSHAVVSSRLTGHATIHGRQQETVLADQADLRMGRPTAEDQRFHQTTRPPAPTNQPRRRPTGAAPGGG
jgi:hypothetical protein